MSIKIIGAGFPRTGTNTLKISLEMLGYTKTYHMKELLVHPENLHYWSALDQTGTTKWDELYDGFVATVDFPAYPWYKEHMERYPDAKVILTVRPFEKWYSSIYSTIWQVAITLQTVPPISLHTVPVISLQTVPLSIMNNIVLALLKKQYQHGRKQKKHYGYQTSITTQTKRI